MENQDATRIDFERHRLAMLLEKAPGFIAVTRGKDHVIELANDAYCVLTGRRDLVGKATAAALPEIGGQGFIEMLDKVFETGEAVSARGSAVMLLRDGEHLEQRYIDYVCQRIVELDGTTTGVFTQGVDVTDATLAQQRLRAQFDGVPVPTYVWKRVEHQGTREFALIDFNAAANAISRGKIEAFVGTSSSTFFSASPEVLGELERCLDTGVSIRREMDRTLRSTGETRRLFVTYTAVPPDLVVIHTEDVTDRRKIEEQLRQAQKLEAVGRLAGGVAHDFNNILSVILSYSEMNLEDLEADNPLRGDLVEIHKAAVRAVGLTRQLLAFGRKQLLQPRVIDLGETVHGLESMLRRVLGDGIELTLPGESERSGIHADPGQIERVLMNLVVNARDAMPTGGDLTIEIRNIEAQEELSLDHLGALPGPAVLMLVSDTGVGMDAATCARAFEPFFTTKEPQKGTGLGLAMVFGIVHQSGGTISFDSEPGKGTTFRICFPRVSCDPESIVTPTQPELRAGGNETVLIVEDDESVRILACAILRRAGYHVLEAANGGEAFLIGEQFSGTIDVVVTDVVMPRMSGPQLVERILTTRPDLQILYMSGYADDAMLHHGVLRANVALIEKPITSETLLQKVRTLLDGRRRDVGARVALTPGAHRTARAIHHRSP
ncbi:hypothetical protein BH11MYX3_BH11MYX3_04730 [soil metagenome]